MIAPSVLFLFVCAFAVLAASLAGPWLRRRRHTFVLLRAAEPGEETLLVLDPRGEETTIRTLPLTRPLRAGETLRVDWQLLPVPLKDARPAPAEEVRG